jgi:hypothetical protein
LARGHQQVFLKRLHPLEGGKEKIPFEHFVTHIKEATVSIFICIEQALDVVQFRRAALEEAEVPVLCKP